TWRPERGGPYRAARALASRPARAHRQNGDGVLRGCSCNHGASEVTVESPKTSTECKRLGSPHVRSADDATRDVKRPGCLARRASPWQEDTTGHRQGEAGPPARFDLAGRRRDPLRRVASWLEGSQKAYRRGV